MAITRAQQVRQMLREGKRVGFFTAGLAAGDNISPGTSTSGGQRNNGGNGGNQNQFEINRKAKLEKEAKKLADERATRDREEKQRQAQEAFKKRVAKEKKDREEKELSELGFDKTSKFGTPIAKPKITKSNFKNPNIFERYLSNNMIGKIGSAIKQSDFVTNLNAKKREGYLDYLQETDPETYAEILGNLQSLGYADKTTLPGTKTTFTDLGEDQAKAILEGGRKVNVNPNDPNDYDLSTGYTNYLNRALRDSDNSGRGGENIIPISSTNTSSLTPVEETVDNRTELEKLLDARGAAYRFFADGGRVPAMAGGIMNPDIIGGAADGNIDEMGRQMYFVGKLVKKATRAVKKIAKSPIGKAALLYGLGAVGGSLGAGKGLFSKGMFNLANMKAGLFGQAMKPGFAGPGIPGLFNKLGLTKTAGSLMPTALGGITLASLSPFLFQGEEEQEQEPYLGPDIDIAAIRRDPYKYMGEAYRFAADGGLMRTGYAEGSKEPVAKKTMPLIDMDGKEMDLRDEGGFVPLGRMERADDVPARLSKNEFVFTADAVRNAGEGDIDKGAEVMYNMMKNLESGGEVSEESQGLDGAREMFKTSQRLGEVI